LLSVQCTLSASSAFLQSIAQSNLAGQPQPTSTSHGLRFPTALQDSEVHLPRALPQPATFRPQGLVTLAAAYSLRARAGLLSCRRRSWDSPFGAFSFRKVSATFPGGRTHTPFLPSVSPAAKRWAGPTGRGLWALPLPGVPRDRRRISAATAGCSLGLFPLRVWGWNLARPSPDSSHALLRAASRPDAGATECQSVPTTPRPRASEPAAGPGNPLRVLAPDHTHIVRAKRRPGYLIHLASRRTLLPAADAPWTVTPLYRSRSGVL
jgi:hypothetical protein